MPRNRWSSAYVEYVPALCTHRPSLLPIEWLGEAVGAGACPGNGTCARKGSQTWSFRGSTSRNKVSVGEPADGSMINLILFHSLCPISAEKCNTR